MSKMVKCKACGQEIAKGTKCVGCGKDNRNFLAKHKVITGICAVILIAVIANSGNGPKLVEPATTAETVVETPMETPAVAKTKTFKVGDTVELNDYTVKVNKAYVIKSKNEFIKPKEGKEFFGVDCTIINTSATEQTISSIMMFKVVDKDGRSCEWSVTAEGGGQLDGTIGAGRKMTGVYTVETPKGATGLELEFNSSLFGGSQIVVTLN